LGRIDVDKMLAEISSRQLSEWMAFARLEPFGFEADMLGHAITASTVANTSRTKKSQKVFKPDDFIPKERRIPTPAEFFQNLKTYFQLRKDK